MVPVDRLACSSSEEEKGVGYLRKKASCHHDRKPSLMKKEKINNELLYNACVIVQLAGNNSSFRAVR